MSLENLSVVSLAIVDVGIQMVVGLVAWGEEMVVLQQGLLAGVHRMQFAATATSSAGSWRHLLFCDGGGEEHKSCAAGLGCERIWVEVCWSNLSMEWPLLQGAVDKLTIWLQGWTCRYGFLITSPPLFPSPSPNYYFFVTFFHYLSDSIPSMIPFLVCASFPLTHEHAGSAKPAARAAPKPAARAAPKPAVRAAVKPAARAAVKPAAAKPAAKPLPARPAAPQRGQLRGTMRIGK